MQRYKTCRCRRYPNSKQLVAEFLLLKYPRHKNRVSHSRSRVGNDSRERDVIEAYYALWHVVCLAIPNRKEMTMSDTSKGSSQDRKLIALSQDHEVRDWCKSLGCTEAQLRAAVAAVGNSADKVREFLKSK